MSFINHIKRFGVTGWLFVLGLTIGACVLLQTSDVLARVMREDAADAHFPYAQTYELYVDHNDPEADYRSIAEELIRVLRTSDCTVRLTNVNVPVNRQIDTFHANIFLSTAQGTGLRDREKQAVPAVGTERRNIAMVGESMVELSAGRRGRSITLCNTGFEIESVLYNAAPCGIDYSIYLFWDSLDAALQEQMIGMIAGSLPNGYGGVFIRMESTEPLGGEPARLQSMLEQYSIELMEWDDDYQGNDYQNQWYRITNAVVMPVCIIFSVYTCFSVSFLWLSGRRRELSIRKAYGYSNIQLFGLLLQDSVLLTLPAIGASLLFQLIYCAGFDLMDYFDVYFVLKLLAVCAGMLLVVALCVLNLMREVAGIVPAAAVKNDI